MSEGDRDGAQARGLLCHFIQRLVDVKVKAQIMRLGRVADPDQQAIAVQERR